MDDRRARAVRATADVLVPAADARRAQRRADPVERHGSARRTCADGTRCDARDDALVDRERAASDDGRGVRANASW